MRIQRDLPAPARIDLPIYPDDGKRTTPASVKPVHSLRRSGATLVRQEFNVIALIKGAERYVYVYDDASRPTLLACVKEQATNPALSLNWFDAAVLANKAREQAGPTTPKAVGTPRFSTH